MNIELLLLIASILIFSGILFGKVGSRFGIPALLLFLVTGMLFGVDGLGIQFQNMKMVQYLGIVSLSIILFTGGMGTNVAHIRPILKEGLMLSTVGVILTTLFSGLLIYIVTGHLIESITFSLPLSLLLAATMSSTDSASVFALLRSQNIQLKQNIKPALELESGSNDPMAYMLTIALISYVNAEGGSISVEWVVGQLLVQFLVGIAIGYVLGLVAVWILNHLNIHNDELYPITLLCIVLATYSMTALLGGNGYLAVYIAGLIVGNKKIEKVRTVHSFFDGITWLLQIILFILLGLLVNPHEMIHVALPALIIGLLMMFVARPAAVFLSLLPLRKFTLKARVFVSWVGLRGAAPILFATYPYVNTVPDSTPIFNIVFFVTILSLIFQGMTIKPLSVWLGLAKPAPAEGFFVGVEFPEETGTQMEERVVTEEMLENGNKLKELVLDDKELIILVNRKSHYIVPKGDLRLHPKDVLLVVSPQTIHPHESGLHPEFNLITRIKKSLNQNNREASVKARAKAIKALQIEKEKQKIFNTEPSAPSEPVEKKRFIPSQKTFFE